MTAKKFGDLEVWKNARQFSVLNYKITEQGNFKKDFGLKDQLRRASVSIVSNIAEGFERNGNKELVQFLSFAKGSAGEIRGQLCLASNLEYVSKDEFSLLSEKITEISKMISGFINYIKQSDFKGSKFVSEPATDFEL